MSEQTNNPANPTGKRKIIPFGPQHPALPEPIHLDLVVEDEKVIEAIPSIGFIHRGLEKLAEVRDYQDFSFVAERICGICSYIHGLTYCQGVEEIMKVQVPERALYLRVIWSELSRIHSHILWMGLLADAFGFESLFMHSWRLRETVLDIIEETTGGRVIFGCSKIGGTRRDIDAPTLARIVDTLNKMEAELKEVTDVFLDDTTVKHRTIGVGIVTKEDAYTLGAVGPTLRASGIAHDIRCVGNGVYDRLNFKPIVEYAGDSYARTKVRIRELFQSIDLIRQCVKQIPEGPIDVKVTGMPNGEVFMRSEQPRGEVIYHLKADGKKNLLRFRVRTPTFANIVPLVKMLQGCQVADVPILVLTIDPCISCTER